MDTLEFKTRPRSICGIDMRHRDNQHVIIVTELEDNPGMSITNAWPDLANIICEKFALPLSDKFTWIEHYPKRGSKHGSIPESWDQVYLVLVENKFKMFATRHPWQPITEDQFKAIVEF